MTWPEPAPNWSEAKKIWKWGWEIHVFGFASLYSSIAALYAIYNIFSQRKFYLKKKKLHALFLNFLLSIFSFIRAMILLWNPYESESSSKILLVLCVILHGLATACVSSAFSVLLLILLETTKLSLAPSSFQNLRFVIGIWASNVIYVVIFDVTVMHFTSAKTMIFVCQVVFATWGLVISVGYAAATFKIRNNLSSSRKTCKYNTNNSNESAKLRKLTILMCAASTQGFCLFTLSIYLASSDTRSGVFNNNRYVPIWPWFGIQTFLRFVELTMCVTVFLIALKTGSKGGRNSKNLAPTTFSLHSRGELAKGKQDTVFQ